MGWQALVSSMRGRTDCHSPGTPGHGARSRTHPTVERQAGSPDNNARPRWARSAGTHRWCGLQAPSRRALARSTNRPAPDAAGGAAAGGRAVCWVLLRIAVITQATTAAAAEPMCDGASFDLRQAVLNVIPGRSLISCGGQVQHILVCEQVADRRSHGVQGYASTASRATWAWVGNPIVTLAEARDKALENARAVTPRKRAARPARVSLRSSKPATGTRSAGSGRRSRRRKREQRRKADLDRKRGERAVVKAASNATLPAAPVMPTGLW